MQKQQVRSKRPATTAMAISAQGGTARTERTPKSAVLCLRSPGPTALAKMGGDYELPRPHSTFLNYRLMSD